MRKTRVKALKQMLIRHGNAAPTQSDVRQAKRAYLAFRTGRPFRRNNDAITADQQPVWRVVRKWLRDKSGRLWVGGAELQRVR